MVGRPGEVDLELRLHGFREQVPVELVDQFAESRTGGELAQGKASGLGDGREVALELRHGLRANELGYDQVLERLALEGRGAQAFEVDHVWSLRRTASSTSSTSIDVMHTLP